METVMPSGPHKLDPADYSRARRARDVRFDGLFFVAVRTTRIFCRPICPVVPPLEANVEYFQHAAQALATGYRPCLRCRPDSAPGSCAWRGTDTTFSRALALIDAGALQQGDMPALAARLGIGDRYLRRLFRQRLGLSPKAYALYGQVMFAKQLLHETSLSVTEIAAAAGFNSLRRFNDAFLKQLHLSPSAVRRRSSPAAGGLALSLAYRPPLNWPALLDFWRARCLDGVEWVVEQRYGRSFTLNDAGGAELARGWFEVEPAPTGHALRLRVSLDAPALLRPLVQRVRQVLDLDADSHHIERHLAGVPELAPLLTPGLRIPGIWSPFEAGVRAILGQQVSVAAARTHLQRLVAALGEPLAVPGPARDGVAGVERLFPAPAAIAGSDLAVLRIPASRRDTLRRFAAWYIEHGAAAPLTDWLQLKGIGPWTVDYVRLRGLGEPDVWLAGDLGVRRMLGRLAPESGFDSDRLRPWRSYATLQLWQAESRSATEE